MATTTHGTVVNADEALRVIRDIPNPVTRNLVNMAFVHLVKQVHTKGCEGPVADLDLGFIVRSLEEFFSDHDVLARTLTGERVGAWFDEDNL